jgi:UPF0716 protein FxsA
MLGWIILLFVFMPFVEFGLLIWIGQRIGLWPTLGLILATGLIGGVLARWQGLRALRDVTNATREGRVPKRELVAGALFLVAAALLLTPGVLTDVFGFAMMVPWIRLRTAGWLIERVRESDRVQTHVSGSVGGFGTATGDDGARQAYDLDVEGGTEPDADSDTDGEGPPRVP